MPFGIVFDVPAPVEVYDAVHAEVLRRAGSSVDGLLVHVGRPTDRGFQVLEVWESRDQWQRYNDELIGPVMADVAGGQAPPPGEPAGEEFDVRGLVIPRGDVAF